MDSATYPEYGSAYTLSELNGIVIPIVYFDHIKTQWKNVSVNMDEIEPPEGEGREAGQDSDYIEDDNILYKLDLRYSERDEGLRAFVFEETVPRTEPCVRDDGRLPIWRICIPFQERLYFKIKQIGKIEYNWLDEDIVGRVRSVCVGSDCAEQIPDIEKTIIHHKMEFEHTKIDVSWNLRDDGKVPVQREGGFGVGYHGVGTEMREFYYDGAFDSDGGVCVVVQEHGGRRFLRIRR
jgi:hypothetical protein